MRLIDADELKKRFIGNRYGTKAIEYVIDDAPTVEAIPLEYVTKNFHHSDFEQAFILILRMWEKENETN